MHKRAIKYSIDIYLFNSLDGSISLWIDIGRGLNNEYLKQLRSANINYRLHLFQSLSMYSSYHL